MLVKFLVLFLIFYCPAVYANETATRCIGAIKAFEQSDRNEDLKKAFTKILLGKYGFARMLKGGESLPAPASVSASNEGHIRYCTKFVEPEQLSFMLKVLNGYIGEEALSEIKDCHVSILHNAMIISEEYGSKAGYNFGSEGVSAIGAITYILYEMFDIDNKAREIEIADKQVTDKLATIRDWYNIKPEETKELLKKHAKLCSWYEIPVTAMAKGVWLKK